MNVTFKLDETVDSAYVSFGEIAPGEAVEQVPAHSIDGRYEVILDLDHDGHLLGVEVIGASEAFRTKFLNPLCID